MSKTNFHSRQQDLSTITKEMITAGQEVWLEANGYSMYPTMKPGDKIKVAPFPIEDISSGDLIAFQRKSYFVLHRVQAKYDVDGTPTLLTKGDAEFNFDEPVNAGNFLGKITHFKRKEIERAIKKREAIGQLKTTYNWLRKKLKTRLNWF